MANKKPVVMVTHPSLRGRLIRVAHANPELRKDLLPLLRDAKTPHPDARAVEKAFGRAAKAVQKGEYSASLQNFERSRVPDYTYKATISVNRQTSAWPSTGPTYLTPTFTMFVSMTEGHPWSFSASRRMPPEREEREVGYLEQFSDLAELSRLIVARILKFGLKTVNY